MANDENSKFERAKAARAAGTVATEEIQYGTSNQRFQESHVKERQRVKDAQEKIQRDAAKKQQQATEARNTTGGAAMDAALIKAEENYKASRRIKEPAAPNALPTFDVIYMLVEKYLGDTSAGKTVYPSEDNITSICNCFVEFLILGWPATLTTLGAVHAFLLKNGRGILYLELKPNEKVDENGNVVRSRSDNAVRPAAEVYPRYVSPDIEVAARFAQLQADQEKWLKDVQATKRALASGKLPFEELQRQVRKQFKQPKPGRAFDTGSVI